MAGEKVFKTNKMLPENNEEDVTLSFNTSEVYSSNYVQSCLIYQPKNMQKSEFMEHLEL